MPRTRSLAWAELKIGILAVVAVLIAGVLIFLVGGQGGFFWERYPLKTSFNNVAGLKRGGIVRVAGVEVGKVTDTRFNGAEVEVLFDVNEEMRDKITTESRATIGSLSLLGESLVDISAAPKGKPLPDGGYVTPLRGATQISDMMSGVADRANEGLQEATALIKEIRAGKGTVGQLFTNEDLYNQLHTLVEAAGDVATNLNRTRGTAGLFINDPTVYRQLQTSLEHLSAVTEGLNKGEGSLGRLLKDDTLAKSLASTTTNLDTLTGRLNKGEGTAGKLLTDDQLYTRMNSMVDRLDQVAARLSQGEGTAGQLLHDKQLYENMNGAVAELRNLLTEIKKDPKKYLNVRVSIF